MNLTMSNFKIWSFPNGEWGVKLDPTLHPDNHESIVLDFHWPDPLNPDLMLPILMGAAIRQVYGRKRILRMPYMPYLRQDRSFEHGIPIASAIAAKMLCSVFSEIETLEPHSIPCPGVKFIEFSPNLSELIGDRIQIVYPDENVIPLCSMDFSYMRFKKIRIENAIRMELDEGEKHSDIDAACIVDDLCDGGATFIECARQLREMGFKKVVLCVAHGLFSKGVDHLFNNGIDKIITTDSVCKLEPRENLRILNSFEEMDNA